MIKTLKVVVGVMAIITIFVGFFAGREHSSFFWHRIPSLEAVFGALGTLILIFLSRILALIAFKKEDFYD
jgi:hypothetical protein